MKPYAGQRFQQPAERDEPSCPLCHRHNALLQVMTYLGKVQFRECRDCHEIFLMGESDPGSDIVTFYLISRSIGKTCSACRSFNMKEMSPEAKAGAREMLEREGKKSYFAPNWFCCDCGKEARY